MEQIVLVVHLILAIALVAVVLLQRSEGGALGIGGGGGGGVMSGRAASNALTKATAILATSFICTSLLLAVLAGGSRTQDSILDTTPATIEAPVVPAPTEPTVPLSE